ncbi:MAG: DedA family protein [Pseudomonadota bacterium]
MPELLESDVLPALLRWIEQHQGLAVAAVFFIGFAESIVLLAVLVPSTILLAGIGSSFAATGGSIELLWISGAVGATAGDSASFAIGRYFRDDLPRIWPFRRYPMLLERSELVFRQWGWFALIASKFAFGVRPFVPLTAGALSMPFIGFLVLSAISCILWAGTALGIGYGLARAIAYWWSL